MTAVLFALSKELKALGVPRGEPGFKIRHLIKKHDIKLFSSNYSLYGNMSSRVMDTLSQFSPDIEIYSIDEAFLLLNGFDYLNLTEYCKIIKQTVEQWTGIPVSIGIGPTKTLAKVANRIAKKYKKFNGVFDITDHPKIDKILEITEVEDVWGVGRQYGKMLRRNGIYNALQLSMQPDGWIRKSMTVVGLKTAKELRGISCIDLETDIPAKKQIVCSRSFGKPVDTFDEMFESVSDYCTRAVAKLRRQHSVASMITVFIGTNRFKDEPQYSNSATARLLSPSAYTPDFLVTAHRLLKTIYKDGYNYKRAGVMIADIMEEKSAPLNIFNTEYVGGNKKDLMDCIDTINTRWGRDNISFASSGIKKSWSMRRELLSPRFTTNWDELPVAIA